MHCDLAGSLRKGAAPKFSLRSLYPRQGRPMRVVLDLRSVHPGLTGIGRYAANLCLSLSRLESSVELAGITTSAGKAFLGSQVDIPLHLVAGTPDWEEFGLPDLLRRLGADVYHSPLFVLPKVRACAYVCTIHDVIPTCRPELTSKGFSEFFHENVLHALRAARHVVTVSEFTRKDLFKHFAIESSRVTTVYEPVSPHFRRWSPAQYESTVREFGLRPGFILSVGAIDRRKNLSRLIEAYQLLTRRVHQAPPLALVGAPSGDGYDISAEISARGLERSVVRLGRVSDQVLSHLYCAAGCFVFPSLYEGFGLPVLEAMASGTPVIASNVSSIPEVAGDAALLINPTDAGEIRRAIEQVFADSTCRDRLVQAGLHRAKEFTLDHQASQLSTLYGGILSSAA